MEFFATKLNWLARFLNHQQHLPFWFLESLKLPWPFRDPLRTVTWKPWDFYLVTCWRSKNATRHLVVETGMKQNDSIADLSGNHETCIFWGFSKFRKLLACLFFEAKRQLSLITKVRNSTCMLLASEIIWKPWWFLQYVLFRNLLQIISKNKDVKWEPALNPGFFVEVEAWRSIKVPGVDGPWRKIVVQVFFFGMAFTMVQPHPLSNSTFEIL